MVVNRAFRFTPQLPPRGEIDAEQASFNYDALSDMMIVHFHRPPRPGVAVQKVGDLFYRVDPETQAVVGFQIEYFLNRAILEHPGLLSVAQVANIDARILTEIRERIAPERRERAKRESALGELALAGD